MPQTSCGIKFQIKFESANWTVIYQTERSKTGIYARLLIGIIFEKSFARNISWHKISDTVFSLMVLSQFFSTSGLWIPGSSQALNILGSHQFTHGRHYWEVEIAPFELVECSNWIIGVSYSSVERNSWLGASEGTWIL